ncbi:hypothetical protein CPG38_13485 [Malaciobacter marinus]|uniref:hypothetical protein n=1 Tax=Malaciobacter marinus TaxID=505249 RepID=UPI000C082E08|nr:hypothetical protein [Malaciobacter marinus]PHO11347.1 hypothetical protein CPG38_13485 [Malaciobacter marinus]
MNNYINVSFEDDIFADLDNDYTKNSNENTVQREREDVDNLDENLNINLEKQKMEVFQTYIICDGSGFQNLIEKDEVQNFSKYKFNNFRVSDNEYLIKLEKAGGALNISDEGELMLRSSPDADFKKVTPDKASIVIGKLIGEHVIVGKGSKDRPPDIKYSDLMLISEIVFEVQTMSEFFKSGNTYKMNKFKPSKYLMLDKNLPYKKPKS